MLYTLARAQRERCSREFFNPCRESERERARFVVIFFCARLERNRVQTPSGPTPDGRLPFFGDVGMSGQ